MASNWKFSYSLTLLSQFLAHFFMKPCQKWSIVTMHWVFQSKFTDFSKMVGYFATVSGLYLSVVIPLHLTIIRLSNVSSWIDEVHYSYFNSVYCEIFVIIYNCATTSNWTNYTSFKIWVNLPILFSFRTNQ